MLNHHTHPTDPIQDKKTNAFDMSMASPSRFKSGSEARAVEICSFELSGKEIFFNYDETKSKEKKNKKNGSKKKANAGRAYDTGHGGSKATLKWQ